jgi:uncharacterized membrane protein
MILKSTLAVLWSLNGVVEKSLLQNHSPNAYAATKSLCVAATYLVCRQPIDVSILKHYAAWILIFISVANTPLYAQIAKQEDVAYALPIVSALSNVLRLVWCRLLFDTSVSPKNLIGFVCILVGGVLTR